MKRLLNSCALLACLCGLASLQVAAQETQNSFFTGAIGGGFTTPVDHAGTELDNGWNLNAQAGMNLFDAHLSLVGEFAFNDMGINSSTLSAVGFPGGSTYLWRFSGEPIIRFRPQSRVSFYLIGGPGVYHRVVDFTQPALATFTGFDPFFGVFYPVAVPVNQVVLSYSTTTFGWNGGGGINFGLGHGHTKFFAEARYDQMNTRVKTAWIPVTFGFRW